MRNCSCDVIIANVALGSVDIIISGRFMSVESKQSLAAEEFFFGGEVMDLFSLWLGEGFDPWLMDRFGPEGAKRKAREEEEPAGADEDEDEEDEIDDDDVDDDDEEDE